MRFHLTTSLLPLLLLTTPLPTTAQSFFDFSIYTDSACSVFTTGIDGSSNKNCTSLLPNTSPPTYSPPTYRKHRRPQPTTTPIWVQANEFVGTCQVTLYADKHCVDAVSGFSDPPNLGCVAAGDARAYQVFGC